MVVHNSLSKKPSCGTPLGGENRRDVDVPDELLGRGLGKMAVASLSTSRRRWHGGGNVAAVCQLIREGPRAPGGLCLCSFTAVVAVKNEAL